MAGLPPLCPEALTFLIVTAKLAENICILVRMNLYSIEVADSMLPVFLPAAATSWVTPFARLPLRAAGQEGGAA
jgi:hypothetical protein